MKILLLCYVVFVCVQRSLQCGCPYEYTQQIVCDSEIVMKATIQDIEETAIERIFTITINRVYKGQDVLDVVSDNRTLTTPLESAECGPLTLLNGTTYIMTANVYEDGFMHVIFCDYVTEEDSVSPDALLGIERGSYLKDCDCKIPTVWDSNPSRRGRLRCGHPRRSRVLSTCRYDAVCSKNIDGRCKWQKCVRNKEFRSYMAAMPNQHYTNGV